MSLNQSTSMSSSRPSASQMLTEARAGDSPHPRRSHGSPYPGEEASPTRVPPPPPSPPQPPHRSLHHAASPPAGPHGVPGHPVGAQWCLFLHGYPPRGCTGQTGPAQQRPVTCGQPALPPVCCQELPSGQCWPPRLCPTPHALGPSAIRHAQRATQLSASFGNFLHSSATPERTP